MEGRGPRRNSAQRGLKNRACEPQKLSGGNNSVEKTDRLGSTGGNEGEGGTRTSENGTRVGPGTKKLERRGNPPDHVVLGGEKGEKGRFRDSERGKKFA